MEDIDNYIVTSIIGSGCFGTCYKVKHKTSHEEFVWKAVNYGQMSEEKKESLVSEVNVLSKLKHPNIVRYFNHIIHKKSSTLYIIMEYCSGGDLSKVINHCTKYSQYLDETFIWRVLYQIALALNVCHSKCASTVLHRDIKPANVFLDADNNVKLGDFGLAKILDEKEHFTETVVGTPLYMSPELIRNKKYNKKSDIWALGCLIYEVSALVPPFYGNSFKNLSLNINEGKFNRIPDIYSDDLQVMIDFLLSIESERRPSVDVVVRHPTVVSKSNKTITSIYRSNKIIAQDTLDTNLETKFNENLQIRLESVRNREAALKLREEKLNEKERNLNKREKKVILLERLANEKVARANLYLKRSKETKTNAPIKYNVRLKQEVEDLDTSFSADPGDNSILPTSTKIDEEQIVKPKGFVRSKSERRVHFNAQKVFQSTAEEPVVFKEYNFFSDENIEPVVDVKPKKKNYFGIGVLKTLNNKISQSSSSLGSKSSSTTNSSDVAKSKTRPISWSEENKRCAFSLLKLMNNESDKENIHSKITHTKM